MLAEDPLLLEELSGEPEGFLQAAEVRGLAGIDPTERRACISSRRHQRPAGFPAPACYPQACRALEDDSARQGGVSAGVGRFKWCRVGFDNSTDTRWALRQHICCEVR